MQVWMALSQAGEKLPWTEQKCQGSGYSMRNQRTMIDLEVGKRCRVWNVG
jgi:hypothetical protein